MPSNIPQCYLVIIALLYSSRFIVLYFYLLLFQMIEHKYSVTTAIHFYEAPNTAVKPQLNATRPTPALRMKYGGWQTHPTQQTAANGEPRQEKKIIIIKEHVAKWEMGESLPKATEKNNLR